MGQQERNKLPVSIDSSVDLHERAVQCRDRAAAEGDVRLAAMLKLLAHAYDQRAALELAKVAADVE